MSTKTISKIETRMAIGFDDETKAEINALKGKLDKVAHAMSAKNESHGDRLLAVMQAEGANDAPEPELLELGQWVFEGQDEQFESASVRQDGFAALWSCKADKLSPTGADFLSFGKPIIYSKPLGHGFDATNWQNSAIDRETVNDVYYLSDDDLNDSVPHIDDVLAQPNWLSDSVPQITQADLQLIFIKNLSNALIQRMQTMDRFSEDDYTIGGGGGAELMAWDIVYDKGASRFGYVCDVRQDHISIVSFQPSVTYGAITVHQFVHRNSLVGRCTRTITEAELPAFREALEACYA